MFICVCMYNVTPRHVRITVVAMGIQEILQVLRVFLGISYPACKAHALYYTCGSVVCISVCLTSLTLCTFNS
jgi:hypothetical protein